MEKLNEVLEMIQNARYSKGPLFSVDYEADIPGEDDSSIKVKRWMIQYEADEDDLYDEAHESEIRLIDNIRELLGAEKDALELQLKDEHGNWVRFQFSDYHIYMVDMTWCT